MRILSICLLFIIGFLLAFPLNGENDNRNIRNPYSVIPDDNYCDQAYCVVANNGDIVAMLTTGRATEQGHKYVVSSVSEDSAKTWSPMQPLESENSSGSAWVIPYLTSYGRIYAIYCRERKFVFKYSDDNGKTWSANRYEIPVRKTTVDYINDLSGNNKYLWSVSKPQLVKGEMIFTFSKYALKNMEIECGWLMKSTNIDHERDPRKIEWRMFPENECGIVSHTMGTVQEEHTFVSLRNGDLFCNFRTKQGYIGGSYSRDGGKTWSEPEYMTYSDGRPIKHPRACPRLFQCKNGNYLLWFHNTDKVKWWNYRNPAWIAGGVETDGKISWSQPEILLYDNDSTVKMSYPDIFELNEKYYVTETQKTVCGVHRVSDKMLEFIWNQNQLKDKIEEGLAFEKKNMKRGDEEKMPRLPDLSQGGFTVECWLEFEAFSTGDIIADSRDIHGNGFYLWIDDRNTMNLTLNDKNITYTWGNDPGRLCMNKKQHVVFVVDGAPNIVSVMTDGQFNDGGLYRPFGWSWFPWNLKNINVAEKITFPKFKGKLHCIRIYNRPLLTSEVISNYRYKY